MSDTHPRYLVAEGELHRAGDFVIEYQVIDTQPENGNARVLHVGFTEDHAARIAEAFNDHPQIEQLLAELRRTNLLHEQARLAWADRLGSDAARRAEADGFARYGGSPKEDGQ